MPEARLAKALTTLLGLMLVTVTLGCAEDLRVPDPPPGQPCSTLEDCAPAGEPVCGALRACVGGEDGADGVCEATPSLYRQCP
jgi:hypothetical protein